MAWPISIRVARRRSLFPRPLPFASTQAQLDAVSASPNPGVAANQLVQTLANEAVTQSQANIATVNDVAPYVLPTPPTPAAPLCGTGSTQWVSGIDNCVLLGIGGAGFLLLILMSSRGRR